MHRVHPYAERLAPLGVARGKLSDAEGSRGAAPGAPSYPLIIPNS
jgi:hypothetical protein